MSSADVAARLVIRGQVQGVGYRYFAEARANNLGLRGWVRNLPDGNVEAEAEGPKNLIERWIEQLRQGPPFSHVDEITIDWHPAQSWHDTFSIIF
jgi:acylphosphatase